MMKTWSKQWNKVAEGNNSTTRQMISIRTLLLSSAFRMQK